jgi:LPXTG-motif cell wall-anchored protein
MAASAKSNSYQAGQAPTVLTIAGGASASITVRGFCLDFGKPFPTGEMTARGLAADNVRAALNYSMQKGYTEGNAPQVQVAVWYLRDNTWHSEDRTIAQEIVTNATAANAPQAVAGATSLADAVTQNQVSVTGTFVPQTADAFYGDGQITIKNNGTSDLMVYMPIGTVFTVPNNAGGFQDLAAYQLRNVSAQPTPIGTPVPGQSPTVAATGTVTGTATVVGTETAVASPTITGTATVTGTETVVATGTAEVSPTTTVLVETPTAGLETPTAMVETPTMEATPTTELATSTPEATATATGPGVLPQTGGNDANSTLPVLAALVALSLALVGSGAMLASRRRA